MIIYVDGFTLLIKTFGRKFKIGDIIEVFAVTKVIEPNDIPIEDVRNLYVAEPLRVSDIQFDGLTPIYITQ